jgi:hypothetical protein
MGLKASSLSRRRKSKLHQQHLLTMREPRLRIFKHSGSVKKHISDDLSNRGRERKELLIFGQRQKPSFHPSRYGYLQLASEIFHDGPIPKGGRCEHEEDEKDDCERNARKKR